MNAIGLVTEIIDRNGKRRTFGYDGNRRLVRESWHDGGGAVDQRIHVHLRRSRAGDCHRWDDDAHVYRRRGAPVAHRFCFPRARVLGAELFVEQMAIRSPRRPISRWSTDSYLQGRSGSSTSAERRRADLGSSRRQRQQHRHRNAANKVAEVRRFTTGGNISPISRTLTGYDANGRVSSIRHENGSGLLAFPQADSPTRATPMAK
ncbi:MAG: RHS repeat domain-containing protein [Verrucomicrobiales bacterium]